MIMMLAGMYLGKTNTIFFSGRTTREGVGYPDPLDLRGSLFLWFKVLTPPPLGDSTKKNTFWCVFPIYIICTHTLDIVRTNKLMLIHNDDEWR